MEMEEEGMDKSVLNNISQFEAFYYNSPGQDIFTFLLSSLYSVAFVWSIVQTVRIRRAKKTSTKQLALHVLVLVFSASRIVFFLFWGITVVTNKIANATDAAGHHTTTVNLTTAVLILSPLNYSGELLFFTTYLLVALFWTETYRKYKQVSKGIVNTHARQRMTWRIIFVVFNIAFYAAAVAIFTISYLSAYITSSKSALSVPTLAMKLLYGVICLGAAVFVSVFGCLLYVPLRKAVKKARKEGRDPSVHNKATKFWIQQITMIAGYCTVVFTLRGVLDIVTYCDGGSVLSFITSVWDGFLFAILYWVLFELVPVLLLLLVFRFVPSSPRSRDSMEEGGEHEPNDQATLKLPLIMTPTYAQQKNEQRWTPSARSPSSRDFQRISIRDLPAPSSSRYSSMDGKGRKSSATPSARSSIASPK